MADESRDAFVPVRDESGRVAGVMDQATADYFASRAPDPTQSSIDALLTRVTRVRIVPLENDRRGATELRTLLDTSDPAAVAAFRGCFAIDEDPGTFGHCMCFGDPHIELYSGAELVATIGYHHGFSIRWDAWKHDARLKEPGRLLDWMSAHGVDGPRREVEEAQKRGDETRRQVGQWQEAMPACLRPFWDRMDHDHDPEFRQLLLEDLRTAVPAADEQALVLFGWFGSGAGPWSGYPSYEAVPEQLLFLFSTQFLIDVLMASAPTDAQWRGAARFFGGWEFQQQRKKDRTRLSADLKRRLLEAARTTGIEGNIDRAERAFNR